jgi:transposase
MKTKKRRYIMQDNLRKKVKILRALQGITYTEIAEHLEIHRNSFYNWLKGYYDLSSSKVCRLIEIINLLSEG